MIEAPHYSAAGAKKKAVALPETLFDGTVNEDVLHRAVVAYLANQRQGTHQTKTRHFVTGGNQKPWKQKGTGRARQGTHKTKTRGEVAGGGKKPYKQKGTGRARQGSIRAPQFTGGGVVHGPVPRDYSQRTPKKMKAAALRGALSDRARNGKLHVVSGFVDGETPSTKAALAALKATAGDARRVLVVLGTDDEINEMSLRNLPQVHLLVAGQLNTYDVLVSDEVVFTAEALEEFVGVPAEEGSK